MGIIDRLLERRGFIRSAQEQKSAGFMPLETAAYPDGRPDTDKIIDYSTFIDAYRNLPWLYAGAMALAVAATKPALRVYRETKSGKGIEQVKVEGEEINNLLELPNPDISYRELIQVSVINLVIAGNQYWNLVGTQEKAPISLRNRPKEIWWVKPSQINPEADANGAIKAYIFTGPTGREKSLDPSEIIHFRLINPGSYFLGMGMMEPLTTTATLEFNAMAFNKGFLENDGTPPFIFTHPGNPADAERKRFWTSWDERHKGPKKANRAGMIWGGMDVKQIGSTMKDAQYGELRKMNREEILAAIGVPPSVVGLLEYANYSNMEVQQKKFWEDTVIPILGLIADKLTLKLAPLFDDRIWFEFDYSGIKVLQEDEERRARVASMLISNGIKTPNEVRAEMFNGEPYDGGNQYYMSMSLLPVGATRTAGTDKRLKSAVLASADGESEKPSFWRDPERRKVLWRSFEKRVSSNERAMIPEVEKFLKGQANEVRRKLEKADSVDEVKPAKLFDVEDETQQYADRFEGRYRSVFARAGEAGFHATKGKIWIPPEERHVKDEDEFNVRPEHLARLRAQIEQAAKHFNESIWDDIASAIEKAKLDKLTIEELTQSLWQKLSDLSIYRSRLISRTEMGRVENWGQLEGYRQNEHVNRKGWLCSFVEDSREEHKAADGQEVELDDDFTVGNERLAYPGDPRGEAGNVCNCLCATYPVVSEV